MNKKVTTQVCENVLYLKELNEIKYVQNIETTLGISQGYISRCLNNPSKHLSVDLLDLISRYFGVSSELLMYHDLREEKYGEDLYDF